LRKKPFEHPTPQAIMFAIEKPFPQYNFIHLAMDFSDAPYLELTNGGQTKLGN